MDVVVEETSREVPSKSTSSLEIEIRHPKCYARTLDNVGFDAWIPLRKKLQGNFALMAKVN